MVSYNKYFCIKSLRSIYFLYAWRIRSFRCCWIPHWVSMPWFHYQLSWWKLELWTVLEHCEQSCVLEHVSLVTYLYFLWEFHAMCFMCFDPFHPSPSWLFLIPHWVKLVLPLYLWVWDHLLQLAGQPRRHHTPKENSLPWVATIICQ